MQKKKNLNVTGLTNPSCIDLSSLHSCRSTTLFSGIDVTNLFSAIDLSGMKKKLNLYSVLLHQTIFKLCDFRSTQFLNNKFASGSINHIIFVVETMIIYLYIKCHIKLFPKILLKCGHNIIPSNIVIEQNTVVSGDKLTLNDIGSASLQLL